MTVSDARVRIEKILSPAIDTRAPYAQAMITELTGLIIEATLDGVEDTLKTLRPTK